MNYRADIGIVTIVPAELHALFQLFNLDRERSEIRKGGTPYWFGRITTRTGRSPATIVISVLNAASGNTESAISTTLLIRDWAPRLICLCGIAAGMEGRTKIGDVIVAERVHDITIKTLKEGKFRPRSEARSRHKDINEMLKLRSLDLKKIDADATSVGPQISEIFETAKSVGLDQALVSQHTRVHDGSIVSDNTLLRDASFFAQFTEFIDEKCRAGEMEAAGFTRAAELHGAPWVVVRGISDFGDSRKDDSFHRLAAVRAAATLRSLIAECIDLNKLAPAHGGPDWVAAQGSVELEVEQAFRSKKWDAVVELGSTLSRPLWLAGRLQQRIRIGTLVETAAARSGRMRERASALVDDIGWTTIVLGDTESGTVHITDGLKIAVEHKLFDVACKAARHLASISRKQRNLPQALHWLLEGDRYCELMSESPKKYELANRMKLSRAKALSQDGNRAEALNLVYEAREAFKIAQDSQGPRYAESFLIEAEILLDDNKDEQAISASISGYNEAIRFGRKDEALANARFLEEAYARSNNKSDGRLWARAAIEIATEIGVEIPSSLLARAIDGTEGAVCE